MKDYAENDYSEKTWKKTWGNNFKTLALRFTCNFIAFSTISVLIAWAALNCYK